LCVQPSFVYCDYIICDEVLELFYFICAFQSQNELKSKNEELETRTEELAQRALVAETERDGLRNELNDALSALEESRHKLTTVQQVLVE
jgi:hypothetical protein